jgi:hypothetical protein
MTVCGLMTAGLGLMAAGLGLMVAGVGLMAAAAAWTAPAVKGRLAPAVAGEAGFDAVGFVMTGLGKGVVTLPKGEASGDAAGRDGDTGFANGDTAGRDGRDGNAVGRLKRL